MGVHVCNITLEFNAWTLILSICQVQQTYTHIRLWCSNRHCVAVCVCRDVCNDFLSLHNYFFSFTCTNVGCSSPEDVMWYTKRSFHGTWSVTRNRIYWITTRNIYCWCELCAALCVIKCRCMYCVWRSLSHPLFSEMVSIFWGFLSRRMYPYLNNHAGVWSYSSRQ